VVPDHAVLQRVAEAMAAFDRSHGDQSPTVTFLETAGGVNSPGASGARARRRLLAAGNDGCQSPFTLSPEDDEAFL